MITIGQILKPQGVRGEVKVKALTDDPSRFCVLKSVYVNGMALRISSVRVADDTAYITFAGITDRNEAEKLRGAYVTIDRSAAKKLDDGEFFITDVTGAQLYARGENAVIGTIRAVNSFGAADVFEVDCPGGATMSFAFVKELLPELTDGGKTLTVDGEALKKVAVYDED